MIDQMLMIAFGGAIGAVLRWLSVRVVAAATGHEWLGNVAVNILGCFGMGLLFALLVERAPGPISRLALFAIVGFLGAYTAFSAFSLDTILMIERGHVLTAVVHSAGSVTLALLAIFIGLKLARVFV